MEKRGAENPDWLWANQVKVFSQVNRHVPKTLSDASLTSSYPDRSQRCLTFGSCLRNTFMACFNHPVYIQLGWSFPPG